MFRFILIFKNTISNLFIYKKMINQANMIQI